MVAQMKYGCCLLYKYRTKIKNKRILRGHTPNIRYLMMIWSDPYGDIGVSIYGINISTYIPLWGMIVS